MITNADTGVLLSIGTNDGNYLATTNGTSVNLVAVGSMIAGQQGAVEPMLQAQDGSFVGSVFDEQGNSYMVAFDAGGSVRWSVANEVPAVAMADGGVIAYGTTVGQAEQYGLEPQLPGTV